MGSSGSTEKIKQYASAPPVVSATTNPEATSAGRYRKNSVYRSQGGSFGSSLLASLYGSDKSTTLG